LLANLDELDQSCSVVGVTVAALRAVVGLHKPVYWQGIEMVCDWCDITSYPCPTIEAIKKELG